MKLKCPYCGQLNEYKEFSGTQICKSCGVRFNVQSQKPFYNRGESGVLNSSLYSSYRRRESKEEEK